MVVQAPARLWIIRQMNPLFNNPLNIMLPYVQWISHIRFSRQILYEIFVFTLIHFTSPLHSSIWSFNHFLCKTPEYKAPQFKMSPFSCQFVHLTVPNILCNILFCVVGNSKIHYRFHEVPPIINILCQINPISHSHPATNIFLYLTSLVVRLFTPFLSSVPEFSLSY